MPPASRGLELRVEARDFQQLFARSSQVDPQLRRHLRRNIRTVAATAARDSQRAVLEAPRQPASGGRSRHRGLRAGIAAGIKVAILTGNNRVGVQVVASGGQLPDDQRNLVRAYGRAGGWRHPVFGNTAVWASQIGRPGYFYPTIGAHRDELTRAVTAAMREAAASLEGP